jgi:tetratricopeptide (TPR) repeat protein
MRGLAELLLERGEYDPARDLLVKALDISRTVRGEAHPATLLMMATLGKLYIKMGDNDAAEKTFQRAIDTGRASLPPGHTIVTRIELLLAGLHDLQGRHELAEPVLVAAVAHLRRQFGEQDPLTKEAVAQLVEHYTALGLVEDAKAAKQGQK